MTIGCIGSLNVHPRRVVVVVGHTVAAHGEREGWLSSSGETLSAALICSHRERLLVFLGPVKVALEWRRRNHLDQALLASSN